MKRKLVSSSQPTMGLESLESRRLMSLTASLVNVPMPAAALKADPTLANYKIMDLQVTLDKGERWIATDLQAELTTGNFYDVSAANGGANFPQANLWSLLPVLQADSFVSASNFGRPTILGEFNPTLGNGGVFKSKEYNVSYGAVSDSGTGTFTVARLTMSNDATGTISGDLGSTETPANTLKPYSFSVSGGNVVQVSSISGNVFNDSNGNGSNDENAGMTGITVYLDKNGNGVLDSGEKSQVTNSSGNFTFPSLTAGTYSLHVVLPTGFRRTFPSKTSYSIVLANGVNGTGKNFGLTNTALLSGTVFSDKNSNDKLDSGETGLAGFTVWIDSNNNGKIDTGEKIAGTDANGYWVFKSIKAGTYNVKIQAKTGYKTIGTSSISIKLAPGGSYTGRLFAEHKIA